MSGHLFSAKPLTGPMWSYCKVVPQEQTKGKTLNKKVYNLLLKKMHLKMLSANVK